MAKIFKLPKHCRATVAKARLAREALDDIDFTPEARAILDNALYVITDNPGERAVFTMINNDQFRYVSKEIMKCRNVATTFAVWNVAITRVRQDTGEILATREQLAQEAETKVCHVSTAMSELSKIGAILKEKRGRNVVYKVNPHVAWNGGEGARLAAAKNAPKLRLVHDGDIAPVADWIVDRATEYLSGADWQARSQWAKRAVELGADKIKAMTSKENLSAWARWVALEMVSDDLISGDR
jgi:uncharacterized protein YoxC